MELGISKSGSVRAPECSSTSYLKLFSEGHQDFPIELNLLSEQCTWTD